MPRRPPAYPLPRGMIWTKLPWGAYPHGALDFDWLYRTPAFPDGISQIRVTNLPLEEQDGLAEYWFRLNFVPFEGDRPRFTLGVSVLGGSDLLEPEHEAPLTFLEQEFLGAVSSEIIADLATRLLQESAEWSPVPPETVPLAADDPATAAREALERVEADLSRVGPGHNKGPPLDPAIIAEIRDAVQVGLQSVSAGSAGKNEAGSAATSLTKLAGTIGTALAAGIAKKVGENAEPFIKHGLAALLDHMLQAASALLNWIASIPPGPLL